MEQHERPWGAASAIAALLLQTWACSSVEAQVGLSNAARHNRTILNSTGHDSIANGRESCEPLDEKQADPLPNRIPPCEEEPGGASAARRATLAAHTDRK